MVSTTRILFIVTVAQFVPVLGVSINNMKGVQKRIPQTFVCTGQHVVDSRPVGNPVMTSTDVGKQGLAGPVSTGKTTRRTSTNDPTTSETTRGTSTYDPTTSETTHLNGMTSVTAPSTQMSRNHTTIVLTTCVTTDLPTSRVTNKSDTSVVATAADSTTDPDSSTVGSTTNGTTLVSSTEAITQDTTDVSTTDLTIATTPTTDQTPAIAICPFGYLATFNNSCYRISNNADPILSRSDARKLCESESSHLVFIESAEEDAFLINLTSPGKQYWIGANGLPNNFYWNDGTEIVYKYIADQNIVFDDQRGCYRMKVVGDESSWPDALCFRKYNYICEYEVGRETKQCPDDMSICSESAWINLDWAWEKTAPELQNSVLEYFDGTPFKPFKSSRGIHYLVYRSSVLSSTWCSFRLVTDCMTWNDVPELNTSYAFVTSKLRWQEALETCGFYDSYLVSVENEEENTSLQSLISGEAWLGLSKDDKGSWIWHMPNSSHVYFNWAKNQPNTLYSCTAIDYETAKWKTKLCDSHARCVCERRQEE